MAFGTQDDTDDVMNEINMTPLVDVMLVLLIIFIITVPGIPAPVHATVRSATGQGAGSVTKPILRTPARCAAAMAWATRS